MTGYDWFEAELLEVVKRLIKRHEGLRLEVYNDSVGKPTIGYGHLIKPGETEMKKLTLEEADELFESDFIEHLEAAEKIPGFANADFMRRAAIIDLTFNMGPVWYKKFPKFTAAFVEGNYVKAAAELENSRWYRQVGSRARTIVELMKRG